MIGERRHPDNVQYSHYPVICAPVKCHVLHNLGIEYSGNPNRCTVGRGQTAVVNDGTCQPPASRYAARLRMTRWRDRTCTRWTGGKCNVSQQGSAVCDR